MIVATARVKAGKFRHLIEVYEPSIARNNFGADIETFPGTATSSPWASIVRQPGKEATVEGDRTEAQATMRFTFYATALTEKARLKFDSRWFRITSIIDVDELGAVLRVDAVEIML